MKKPKTVKYFINTYLSDTIISNEMEVSKTTFYKQLNDCIKKYNSQESDSEMYVDKDIYYQDFERYTSERTIFSCGICSLEFVKLVCNEGYYFTK